MLVRVMNLSSDFRVRVRGGSGDRLLGLRSSRGLGKWLGLDMLRLRLKLLRNGLLSWLHVSWVYLSRLPHWLLIRTRGGNQVMDLLCLVQWLLQVLWLLLIPRVLGGLVERVLGHWLLRWLLGLLPNLVLGDWDTLHNWLRLLRLLRMLVHWLLRDLPLNNRLLLHWLLLRHGLLHTWLVIYGGIWSLDNHAGVHLLILHLLE
jgi:hypothetical protein